MGKLIGYARVSTRAQDTDRQVADLMVAYRRMRLERLLAPAATTRLAAAAAVVRVGSVSASSPRSTTATSIVGKFWISSMRRTPLPCIKRVFIVDFCSFFSLGRTVSRHSSSISLGSVGSSAEDSSLLLSSFTDAL
ncbi:hypothetical protein BJ994_002702 [Arthrobacter pigmenti]|uniref:Uncharacterized protein n=1 Tax=Arthrobacter pigmenti TaxID=271432 RepID=A0A846RX99_9MICC|nr:hypothetical protein [Arthrobacter pigmenti]